MYFPSQQLQFTLEIRVILRFLCYCGSLRDPHNNNIPTPELKLTLGPLWLKWIYIDISSVEYILLVANHFRNVGNVEVFMLCWQFEGSTL